MSIKSLNEVGFDLQLLNLIREIHTIGRNDFIADLHTHTIFSDGFLSPKELIHKAIMDDIDIIAITDHNSVKGIVEALKVVEKVSDNLQKKICVIPGIEFSTAIDDKRIHIVGLFVNIYSPYLLNCIEKVKIGHFERAKIQLEKLKKIGVYIGFDEYKQIVGDRCPNWKTMAEAIVRKKYASDIEEARRLYTKKGKPAHVSYTEKWHKITPTSAMTAIKKAGGLTFVAHLGDIEKEFGERDTKRILYFLIENGLDGVDLSLRNKQYSSVSNSLMNFINSKGLLTIIGSDFHKDESLLRLNLNTGGFLLIFHKKIRYLIQEQQYSSILKSVSFEDLRFFPSQIIPNDFLDYEAGIRNILLEQRLNSPYLLIKDLTVKESDNSLFWNIGFGSMLFAISTVKAEHYINKNAHKELSEIRKLLSDRVQKTIDIKPVEELDTLTKKFIEDNLLIYSPLAYRLCYYDLGYKLRTESLMKLYPKLSSDIEKLYNNIINKTFRLTKENIERYIENKKNYFYSILSEMGYQGIEIHSRIKQPISLWDKLKICWFVGYDWKRPEFKNDAGVFLKKVRGIWIEKNPDHIDSKEFRSIFEDFIAFRIVIKNSNGIDMYRDISNAANILLLLDKVYKIELKSRKWHHKRLLILGWDKYSQNELPVEIQCMNWVDYLLSRAYYWYSKGVYIYKDLYPYNEPSNYGKLVEGLKNSKFEDLHNMMFEEFKKQK